MSAARKIPRREAGIWPYRCSTQGFQRNSEQALEIRISLSGHGFLEGLLAVVSKRQAASSQLKADKCQSRRKNRYGFARMSFGSGRENLKGAKKNSGSKRKKSWRRVPLRTKNRRHFLNKSRAPVYSCVSGSNVSPLCLEQIPRLGGGFGRKACSAQQQDQDDERNRNSDEPEKNGHVTFLSSWKIN